MAYWSDLLAEWQTAVRKKAIEAFFISATENRNNTRTTYQTLGSIQAFTDYLIRMAQQEAYGHQPNVMLNSTFGVTENGQL